MKRRAWYAILSIILIALGTLPGGIVAAIEIPPPPVQQAQEENLLANPGMEDGFYWQPPNHFIANGWQRWWLGEGIPEYDDVRDWRPWRYDGEHAQVYFRWGVPYTAGIYQQVSVRPCTYYRFSIYGRNHSDEGVNHHAKVGIDPLGRDYGLYLPSLPNDIVWSPEKTYFYVWGLHVVEAESRSDRITVITYVSPDYRYTPYDTFWDAGSLIELPPSPGPFPEPVDWAPSSFIANITTHAEGNDLVIEWDTTEPASSQLWYEISPPVRPAGSHRVFLPLVLSSRQVVKVPELSLYTPADKSDTRHHRAVIRSLYPGERVDFVVLARHLSGGECVTVASEEYLVTFEP